MIYVSSSCLREKNIIESVEVLANRGFRHMELSSGSGYCSNIEREILRLKNKYGLNYLCHNYFPPLKKPLVLNLSSLNDNIFNKTIGSLENSIKLSRKMGVNKFGFHAGFFLDFKVEEIGKKISCRRLFDRDMCIARFCEGFRRLESTAGNLELYIENNVISHTNFKTFQGISPVMLVCYRDYLELKKLINFKLLLDVGHLKVSSQSLGLNFEDELSKMMAVSDYLHISDNDGSADQNRRIKEDSDLFALLRKNDIKGKLVTLEVNEGIAAISRSFQLLERLM